MSSKGKTSSKDKDFIFSRPGGQSVSQSEIVFYALLHWLKSDSFHINQSKLNWFFTSLFFIIAVSYSCAFNFSQTVMGISYDCEVECL